MIYFGIVENINDPLLAGRVQVRVQPFYRNFALEDLPWAFVERSTDFGPTNSIGWNQHNLQIGTQVTVEFLDDKMQQPLVRGIVPTEAEISSNPSFNKRTLEFANGAKITIDGAAGEAGISVYDGAGNYIITDKDGIYLTNTNPSQKIKIESKGDIELKATSDINITVTGNANIKSTGETTIDATNLKLKNIMGTNKLCSLPTCLFTGAIHQSQSSD